MLKKYNRFKNIKILKNEKKKGRRKKKKKGKLHRTSRKPNIKAEVYNNKKCG